ncbi:signal transduction histidine kinase [Mycolicibacterium rhodesiae NBB3]|uniref:Signal transduction histidine kinase n=1 Tax=Mycolicibacterium rhodesiae (strain NBB3) TaxID=710685 RepID=G8RUF3_MYCRN|nr:sensor histidine kinase [Mycolicibacterium rhodesiae]AEV74170.1 signal transduction histidine kinase [Mycolicibacterium rhodesiae NBB3]
MNRDAPDGWPRGGEWNWLWEAYAVGLAVATIVAVVLLDHRFPGNVVGAAIALSAMAAVVLAFGRRVTRSPDRGWRAVAFVTMVVGLWILAMLASPVSVAAVIATYPVVFSTLPLRTALVVTTIVNLIPLGILLLTHGIEAPNLTMAVAITLIGVVAAPVVGTVITRSMKQRRQLALLVAELAATRAESARLSREAGTAAERERLAREIHDTLAQGFTSIVMLAQAIEPELESDTAAAKRHVELIGATARENLAEARAMVAELTPSPLEEPLPAAIARQCDRLAAETDAAMTVRIDGDLPAQSMSSDVVLLRAAQEAFANIRKHARADAVTVELTPTGTGVRLAVTDNGIGFNGHPEGFGLRGMRARVAQVGGTMTLATAEGGGTRLTVEVPS